MAYNLALNINANSAKLSQGLAKGKKSLTGFQKTAQTAGKKVKASMTTMLGGMTSSLGMLVPGFSGLGIAISGASKAFKGLTISTYGFATALVSTGIGAILVGLGVALAALITYFKGTKDGADKFNKVMGAIGGVIQTVMARIRMLGKAVSLVLKGKFKEGAEVAKEAFTDLGKTIKENVQTGIGLAERENKLNKQRIKFKEKESELTRDIAEMMLIANNENKSINERKEAAIKAEALTLELGVERKQIAEEELDILVKKNALGDNTYEDDQAEADKRIEINAIKEEEFRKMRRIQSTQQLVADDAERELVALKKGNELKTLKVTANVGAKVDTTNLQKIKDILQDTEDTFTVLPDLVSNLGGVFNTFFANMEGGFGGILKAFGNMLKSMVAQLAAKAAIFGVLKLLSGGLFGIGNVAVGAAKMLNNGGGTLGKFTGMFANGTNYAPGGMALVGERGPELVNLPRGSQVYSNSKSKGMMGGEVVFRIEGNTLVGVLNKQNKIMMA
jgi:hypothetical protein